MEIIEKRKVRKDFNPNKEYSVDVSGCTDKEKEEVQQAFFDVGFQWLSTGKTYNNLEAVQYSNTTDEGTVTIHLLYGITTQDCNMTAKDFLDLVYEPEKQGHIHSENMALYAEDAKTHSEPWKLWQVKFEWNDDWFCCVGNPVWESNAVYRRKLKTHIVNGVEIPDLRIKPEIGQCYWCPDASKNFLVWRAVRAHESSSDNHRLANNLCYEDSEEGKQAAILHSMAWLGV